MPAVTFVSGVLAGLMLCTSPGVFLAFMPFLAALWLLQGGQYARDRALAGCCRSRRWAHRGTLPDAALPGAPALLPTVFPALSNSDRNPGVLDLPRCSVSDAWQVSRQSVFILFATVPVFCLGMVTFWRTGRVRETLALFVAPLVGFGLVFLSNGVQLLVVSPALVPAVSDDGGC